MDLIDINNILDRKKHEDLLKKILICLEENKKNVALTRGIYIYGNPGVGKSMFVKNILNELNYDIICYDSSRARNKSVIEKITKNTMSDTNVLSMFSKKPKKIAIIMDEIDGMNNGDKASLTSLIKLIRGKKTKKQKKENNTMTPVICIGNYHIDKKINELKKACICIELKQPTINQSENIIRKLFKNLDEKLIKDIADFTNGDLRKINTAYDIYNKQNTLFTEELLKILFQKKILNEDTKEITKNIFNNHYKIKDHNIIINETDRTSLALLYHENIVDLINDNNDNNDNNDKSKSISFYLDVLNKFTYADYIDRITFQKQIWIFNEITSLMKTFDNNDKYHTYFSSVKKYNPKEVRFTKILTKYSTEYNNLLFIQNMCKTLNMDKKDMLSHFINLRNHYKKSDLIQEALSNYNISRLEIQRVYRFIDRYTNKEKFNEE